MDRFWHDAVSVFETASSAPAGIETVGLNILIGGDGALRIVSGDGWQPEALRAHYGARTVYQVTRSAGGVKVAGHSLNQNCVLQSASPASFASLLGAGPAFYPVCPHRLIS